MTVSIVRWQEKNDNFSAQFLVNSFSPIYDTKNICKILKNLQISWRAKVFSSKFNGSLTQCGKYLPVLSVFGNISESRLMAFCLTLCKTATAWNLDWWQCDNFCYADVADDDHHSLFRPSKIPIGKSPQNLNRIFNFYQDCFLRTRFAVLEKRYVTTLPAFPALHFLVFLFRRASVQGVWEGKKLTFWVFGFSNRPKSEFESPFLPKIFISLHFLVSKNFANFFAGGTPDPDIWVRVTKRPTLCSGVFSGLYRPPGKVFTENPFLKRKMLKISSKSFFVEAVWHGSKSTDIFTSQFLDHFAHCSKKIKDSEIALKLYRLLC